MNFILYLFLILIFLYFINVIFLKYNFLVSETGDSHQRFASKNKIPLSGGIFLFLSFLYMIDDNILLDCNGIILEKETNKIVCKMFPVVKEYLVSYM